MTTILMTTASKMTHRHGFADGAQLCRCVIFEAVVIKIVVIVVVRLAGAEGSRVGAEVAHGFAVGASGQLIRGCPPRSFGVASGGSNSRRSARRLRTAGPFRSLRTGRVAPSHPVLPPPVHHSLAWAQILGDRLPGSDDPVVRRRALESAQASRPPNSSVSIA